MERRGLDGGGEEGGRRRGGKRKKRPFWGVLTTPGGVIFVGAESKDEELSAWERKEV